MPFDVPPRGTGYLPGPIDAGRWALALGPVVLNPLGMGWRADIVLERGAPLPNPTQLGSLPVAVSERGVGWCRGDVHMHTVHSDGRYQPGELVTTARDVGLDFIVSTEHNTSSANRASAACHTDGLLVIAGGGGNHPTRALACHRAATAGMG